MILHCIELCFQCEKIFPNYSTILCRIGQNRSLYCTVDLETEKNGHNCETLEVYTGHLKVAGISRWPLFRGGS